MEDTADEVLMLLGWLEIIKFEETGLGLGADHHHRLDHGGLRVGGGAGWDSGKAAIRSRALVSGGSR